MLSVQESVQLLWILEKTSKSLLFDITSSNELCCIKLSGRKA